MKHRWVALGAAPMDDAQALQWAGLADDGGVVATSLEVSYSPPLCLICLADPDDAEVECPGRVDDLGHLWQTSLVVPVELGDGASWEDVVSDQLPQSIAVMCALCGATPTEDLRCPARSFWVDEVDDVDPRHAIPMTDLIEIVELMETACETWWQSLNETDEVDLYAGGGFHNQARGRMQDLGVTYVIPLKSGPVEQVSLEVLSDLLRRFDGGDVWAARAEAAGGVGDSFNLVMGASLSEYDRDFPRFIERLRAWHEWRHGAH